jgi:hypothetical protein
MIFSDNNTKISISKNRNTNTLNDVIIERNDEEVKLSLEIWHKLGHNYITRNKSISEKMLFSVARYSGLLMKNYEYLLSLQEEIKEYIELGKVTAITKTSIQIYEYDMFFYVYLSDKTKMKFRSIPVFDTFIHEYDGKQSIPYTTNELEDLIISKILDTQTYSI